MKVLYILAPGDRFNYGDLLFSHILDHYFKELVDKIVFCSTTNSDLSDLGGIPTVSYNSLYKANPSDENYLIVAGGESLFVPWRIILSYVDKNITTKAYCKSFPIVPGLIWHLQDLYLRIRYAPKTHYPFTISKRELPAFKKVIYNSVGYCRLSEEPKLLNDVIAKNIVKDNDYLSVRDKQTSNGLDQMGIFHKLVADSAILMSDCFSSKFLQSKIDNDIKHIPTKGYIYFQIGKAFLYNDAPKYARMLTELCLKHNKKVYFGVIATALDHSDHIALSDIMKYMDDNLYYYNQIPSIWDIMWLIKSSSLYVGTSLHGAITAMSFGIPICAHGPNKLKRYLNDWGGEIGLTSFVEFEHIQDTIDSQITNPKIIDANIQMNTVKNSFKQIQKLLSE